LNCERLAVAAGLTVATTAGSHNFDFVKSLGATHVFDHKDPNVIASILKVLKKGDVVYDVIGDPAPQTSSAEVLSKIGGGTLPTVLLPVPNNFPNVQITFGMFPTQSKQFRSLTYVMQVWGLDPGFDNQDIGDAVWRKYIPRALEAGKFQAKPDPEVLVGGLERVQDGIDLLRKGVSAKKLVIEISKEN